MKISASVPPFESRKKLYLTALYQSMEAAGHKMVYVPYQAPPAKDVDFAVFWGFKNDIRPKAQEHGIPFLVSEMNYFGPRARSASLGWNHLARHAIRPEPGLEPRPQPTLAPWIDRSHGKIMVFGQMQRDYAARNVLLRDWYKDVTERAKKHYTREVMFRDHPHVTRNNGFAVPGEDHYSGLEEALTHHNVWLGISYSSTAAVKCIAQGIPCTVATDESMAWDVAGHDVTERIMPPREQWAHWISYTQFSLEEFANGVALRHIMRAYEQARADARA